jgi:hypothetical protein
MNIGQSMAVLLNNISPAMTNQPSVVVATSISSRDPCRLASRQPGLEMI